MNDRLRLLLDRPLDPAVARAVVVLATAVFVGFAAIFVLASHESEPKHADSGRAELSPLSSTQPAAAPAEGEPSPDSRAQNNRPERQDPQDDKSSAAGKRAAAALRTHRALQHIPFHSSGLTIQLVGVRGTRAVVRVVAPTLNAARRGWNQFLRLYRDKGRAYLPSFAKRTDERRADGAARRAGG
jgi:hypothetical protein